MTTAPDESPGRHRIPDHQTSIEGARAIAYRAGSQKLRLLAEYARASRYLGLTDEEAAAGAGLLQIRACCWWKRSSELREAGLIEQIPGMTRAGEAGTPRIACRITDAGEKVAG